MKNLLMGLLLLLPCTLMAQTDAETLFKKGLNLTQQKREKGDPEVPGGLLARHPLLNNARRLFSNATKAPPLSQFREGDTWACLRFSALDFGTELVPPTTTRSLSFENFGAGILKEKSYGNNFIRLYARDNEDIAGVNTTGDLYEAMRITTNGDLILESSILGLKWYERFFMSLIGSRNNVSKLIKIVQKLLVTSISNSDNNGLVFDYSVCPATRVISDEQ